MKNYRIFKSALAVVSVILLLWSSACTRDFDELEKAKYPDIAEVFIDGFSQGLNYAAFGGSKVTAFDVDEEVAYSGSASMKIEIPDAGDPEGSYAGGVYYTTSGRDLSSYDALTFYAKASKAATIDVVGIGNDLGEAKYQASINGLQVNSNWKKYIIPIPDASKLIAERGMFYYSEGPEDGLGYTIWFDEVKYEKLGTIAHKKAMIMDGNDETESAVNGLSFPVSGLSMSFNMPTGIDQTVNVGPAYFSFTSSNTNVASVDEMGMVDVLSAGSSTITATSGSVDADGSLTVVSSGDFTNAPVPDKDPEDVISIFSNAYTDVPVDFYNGYWEPYQTTLSADFTVNDDDVLYYTNFNFVGIQFATSPVDGSSMTHLHMDVWIPNAVDPADKLQITVKDMGPDGTLDDGNDPSITYVLPTPMASQSWISVDIDLSGLPSKSKLAQLVLENLGTGLTGFYLDNVYFYGDGGGTPTGPSVAAPTPPARDAGDVVSIYSDAYTGIPFDNFDAGWCGGASVEGVTIQGNNTLKKITGIDCQGIDFSSNRLDLSEFTHIHFDFYTNDVDLVGDVFNVKLVDFAGGGGEATNLQININTGTTPAIVADTWVSVDVDITALGGVVAGNLTRSDIAQIGITTANLTNVWYDNLYFYKEGGSPATEPTVAAPTPDEDPGDVISLFSDAYTDVTVDTWRTDWSTATLEDVTVAGNAAKKYSSLDVVGITTEASQIDATGMTHFHMDVWSADFTQFSIKLVDFGADGAYGGGDDVEHQLDYPAPAQGQWISYDIPLTDFTGLTTKEHIAQYILVGQPSGATTVWIDNVYFYNDGGATGGGPSVAAPTPPSRDAADVISIYGEAYGAEVGLANVDWDVGSAFVEETVQSDKLLKIDFADFLGTQLNSVVDATEMTHFHMDFWIADDFEAGQIFNPKWSNHAGGAGETNAFELTKAIGPADVKTWVSIDVPITDFTGDASRAELTQFLIAVAAKVDLAYVDNIYFYKDAGGSATEPAVSAPAPTEDPGEVYSIFSDAYTSTTPSAFSEAWGDGTVEDFTIGADNIKKYTNLNFQAINLSETVDLSAYTHIHIDVWTPEANKFGIKLQDFGADDTDEFPNVDDSESELESSATQAAQTWVGHDFAIADFTGLTGTANLGQIQVLLGSIAGGTQGTAFIDNLYLYNDGGGSSGGGPSVAAPAPPSRNAVDVISIYGEAYGVEVGLTNVDWDVGSTFVEETVESDKLLKIDFNDFLGTQLNSVVDATEMTHFHMDIWIADDFQAGQVFNPKWSNHAGGAGETSAFLLTKAIGPTDVQTWVSIDVPITDFDGDATRAELAQFLITVAGLIDVAYIDNIYFYK